MYSNILWQKISSAVLALGSGCGDVISRLKTECMDPAAEADYQQLLSDWKKDDDVVKEMLGMSYAELIIFHTRDLLEVQTCAFVLKSFTDPDDCNNKYCCLTTSALLHHAAIFYIYQSGIFGHRNVNQEQSH